MVADLARSQVSSPIAQPCLGSRSSGPGVRQTRFQCWSSQPSAMGSRLPRLPSPSPSGGTTVTCASLGEAELTVLVKCWAQLLVPVVLPITTTIFSSQGKRPGLEPVKCRIRFLVAFIITYCSVAWSCLTLCDPTNCSTPGFPVLHHLPEFA